MGGGCRRTLDEPQANTSREPVLSGAGTQEGKVSSSEGVREGLPVETSVVLHRVLTEHPLAFKPWMRALLSYGERLDFGPEPWGREIP